MNNMNNSDIPGSQLSSLPMTHATRTSTAWQGCETLREQPDRNESGVTEALGELAV